MTTDLTAKMRTTVRALRRKLKTCQNKVASLTSSNLRMKRQLQSAKLRSQTPLQCKRCEGYENLTPDLRTFFNEQIRSRSNEKRTMRWSDSTIKICQFVIYKSPSCYLRMQTIFNLPSRSTLYRRQDNISSEASTIFI